MFSKLFKAEKLSPETDPNSFGHIACELRYANLEDVNRALAAQEARQPLGDVMVSMGLLTPLQRAEIIFEQRRRHAKTPTAKSCIDLERQSLGLKHVKSSLEKALAHSQAFNATLALKKL